MERMPQGGGGEASGFLGHAEDEVEWKDMASGGHPTYLRSRYRHGYLGHETGGMSNISSDW